MAFKLSDLVLVVFYKLLFRGFNSEDALRETLIIMKLPERLGSCLVGRRWESAWSGSNTLRGCF